MFAIAYLIGIYSYVIFSLGLLGVLYKEIIFGVSIIYVLTVFILTGAFGRALGLLEHAHKSFSKIRGLTRSLSLANQRSIFNRGNSNKGWLELPIKRVTSQRNWFNLFGQPPIVVVFLTLIILQALVNLVGVLGPELGFDALWYHLTLPKIYLENHSIFHIPGGLLYYSGMPKLIEMIYLGLLANDTLSKFAHFGFGILSLITLYKLSRIFLDEKFSLLAVLVFYSNLVVGWQSTTAYIDLARTFFEIMSLWSFINWWKKKKEIWLIESGLMLGLAISTKLLSLGSILIFSFLIAYFFLRLKKVKKVVRPLTIFIGSTLLVPLPYFIFSLLNTGNPIYPVFSEFYKARINFEFVNPLKLSDPISPLYFIFLPFIIFYFRKFSDLAKLVALYSAASFIIWYLTPQTGGGRFLMPYLPAYSLITIITIKIVSKYKMFRTLSIFLIILIASMSIIYRGVANLKYVPPIFGLQSKDQFLTNNLNFSYGDFYDTDGYFGTHLKNSDRVLLYGFHNLYYVNFPFIDASFIKSGDEFNYIATQNTEFPKRFKFWNLVYTNERTGINLYSLGGQKWIY